MTNEAAERKWTFLYDDFERGTVFITDDPTGEQKPLVSGITEEEALAVLAALAAERRATVERVLTEIGPEYDDAHTCQYRLDLAAVRAILAAEAQR